MEVRKLLTAGLCMLLLMTCLVNITTMKVQAEQPAGYHEKYTTEEVAEDAWYAVGRGVYLSYGSSSVQRAGTAKVSISGSTNATRICDELKLALYLDESSDNDSYGTIGVYHYTDTNDATLSGYESYIRVTSGYYYSVRGVHRVTEGSVSETTDTCTNAITAL